MDDCPHSAQDQRPLREDWPTLGINTQDAARQSFNGAPQNIGVQLGRASRGLADVDLDTIEATRVAPYFLAPTRCFGRASKPQSHWLYYSNLCEEEDKAAIQFKYSTGKGTARSDQMILELRIGGGGKGAQTVFPGSIRESGEEIEWGSKGEISQASADLKQRCARAAAAALLAANFPSKGARHDAGLTIGGLLFRCGVSRPDTELFAEAVTTASGQGREKVQDVRKAAREAWDEASRPGGNARGFPALAETFGDDVAKYVAKWLGYRGQPGEQTNSTAQDHEPFIREDRGEESRPFVPRYKNLAAFIREYQPISYTLEGILPSGVFYFLTARRSTGKTAFLIASLFAIILGNKDILGVKVRKGRVAYIALENPTDLRMKLEVVRFHLAPAGVPLDDLADMVTIIDARLPVSEIVEQLTVATEEFGPFQAVFWDTFQAGFQGDEFNDNAGILKYAQQLRTLTELPGRPSVLVAAHPTKNAGEAELIPYGGGSSINEADGNLTLWAEDGSIKLHFNRVRGPEFEPLFYRIEKLSSPDILDDEDRQILLPVMRPVSNQDAEQHDKNEAGFDIDLIKAMAANPDGTQAEWGTACGRKKSSVGFKLRDLQKKKYVEPGLAGKWRLTHKGQKEAGI
jgi:hypothetical protein